MSFLADDLFTTNRAPSDEEQSTLKHILTGYDDRLNGVATRLSALEAEIKFLKGEENKLLEAAGPYRRAMSPFRQLPEDIIRVIFLACLDTQRNPSMSNTEAPVLLTHICSAMRKISIQTPALWNSIHIPIISGPPPALINEGRSIMAARVVGVKEFLARSKRLPLSISVHEPRNNVDWSKEVTKEIINLLLGCRNRWKHLSFSCLPMSLSRIMALSPDHVPLLETLSIHLGVHASEDNRWERSGVVQARSLKGLSLFGTTAISDYRVNWANLTHLSCPHDSLVNISNILMRTVRLVSFHYIIYDYGAASIFFIDRISLLHLTELVITDYHTIPVTDDEPSFGILGMLHCPNLKTVALNTTLGLQSTPRAFMSLAARSPLLRQLSVGRPVDFQMLIECLRLCPHLTTLHIHNTGHERNEAASNDYFLNCLVTDRPNGPLCPELEYFRCEPTLNVSPHALRYFLQRKDGRARSLRALKVLVINIKSGKSDEDYTHSINHLISLGIKVKLTFVEQKGASKSLSQGILNTGNPEVDRWWPSIVSRPVMYY